MISFTNHLAESLDSAQEFTITDDTVMPSEVYATFNVDDSVYGVSIVKSSSTKIYIVDVYQIVNNKPRRWKFGSKSHLRPVISTALKVVEAIIPWIKTQMDGIVLTVSSTYASERFNKMASKVMTKLYIKSLRPVPVFKDPLIVKKYDYYNYLFFVRKQVDPATLFSSKKFNQYKFDVEGEVPIELAADIKPVKKAKAKVSTTASSKYNTFGGFSVKLDKFDPEFFQTIENVKAVSNKDVEEKDKEAAKVEVAMSIDELASKMAKTMNPSDVFEVLLPKLFDSVRNKGFQPSLLHWSSVKYQMVNMSKFSQLKYFLLGVGYMDDTWNITTQGKEGLTAVLENLHLKSKLSAYKKTKLHKQVKVLHDAYVKSQPKKASKQYGVSSVQESNIDLKGLAAPMKGAGLIRWDGNMYTESGETPISKKNYLKTTLGYHSAIDLLPAGDYQAVKSYTGGSSGKNNYSLRKFAEELFGDNNPIVLKELAAKIKSITSIAAIYRSIRKMEPLKEPMWVYRGAKLSDYLKSEIVVGKDYVDPGFMSTSIKSHNTFGMANLRLAIYLPAGSQVLPVLDHSNHSNEMEIILPPMSSMKVVEVTSVTTYGESDVHASCIYMGSAYESMRAQQNKILKEEADWRRVIMEQKEPYSADEKFASKHDPKVSDAIAKLIKSGKLKLDTHKK